jgi:hypothetical protein
MGKELGIAMIPAGLIAFDSMSLDDRGFQAGEEVSDLFECKTLASFEFVVRSLVKLESETMPRLKSCILSSKVSQDRFWAVGKLFPRHGLRDGGRRSNPPTC